MASDGDRVIMATPSSSEVSSTTEAEGAATPPREAPGTSNDQEPQPQGEFQPITPPGSPPSLDQPTKFHIRLTRQRAADGIEVTVPVIRVSNLRHPIEINVTINLEDHDDDANDVAII